MNAGNGGSPLPGSRALLWFNMLTRNGNALRVGALLFVLTACAFLPALGNDFVGQWDDDLSIGQNPHIQGMDAQRLRWMFTDVSYVMRYKPLSWVTYALIYEMNGLKPFGFHLVGLIFHCLNAVMLYLVLRRLLEAAIGLDETRPCEPTVSLSAALGALLWAVHPLRVEPVVWATDINYDQSLFLILISFWSYLRAVVPRSKPEHPKCWYWGAVAAFALAMLTYPVVFGYAAVLVVLDVYPLRRFDCGPGWWRNANARRIWLEKVPFMLLVGIIFISLLGRLNPTGHWAGKPAGTSVGLFDKAMQAFYVWGYYAWKPWFPFNLSPVYTMLVQFNPRSWPFLTSAVGVIGLTILLVWKRREWPLALALWICHLVLILPGLGLTEHPHYASDRYCYAAGILWPALIAAGLARLRHHARYLGRAIAVLAVLSAILGALSFRQSFVWRDSITLYNYVIAKLGDDPYRGEIYFRLGTCHVKQNQVDEAIQDFSEALKIYPKEATIYNFRGYAYARRGDHVKAIADFTDAIRLNPREKLAYDNRGDSYVSKGDYAKAATDYRAAITLAPNDAGGYVQLAWLLVDCPDPSVRNVRSAVELATKGCDLADWKDPQIVSSLAGIYATAGDFEQAVRYQKKAVELTVATGAGQKQMQQILLQFEQHQPPQK